MGSIKLIPEEITPPKDVKVTQDMRDTLIIAQRMITEGRSGLANKWQLFAKGCELVLDKHLYLAAGYTNYKDYFIKHDLDPSHAVRTVNALRMFGDSSLARLPLRRLLQLLSLPEEVIAEIKKGGVDAFIGLSKKGKEFTATIRELKALASSPDSSSTEVQSRKGADDLYKRLKRDDKKTRKTKDLQSKAFVENEIATRELESEVIQFAADLDSLLQLAKSVGAKQLEFAVDEGIAQRVQELCRIIYSPHQHGAAAVQHLKILCEHIDETLKRDGEQGGREVGQFVAEFRKYFEDCRSLTRKFDSNITKGRTIDGSVAGKVVPMKRRASAQTGPS